MNIQVKFLLLIELIQAAHLVKHGYKKQKRYKIVISNIMPICLAYSLFNLNKIKIKIRIFVLNFPS